MDTQTYREMVKELVGVLSQAEVEDILYHYCVEGIPERGEIDFDKLRQG